MNQKKFRESTKHNLVIFVTSVFPRVPIVKSHLQLISTRHLLQRYAAFLRPLVGSMHQHLAITIRFSNLPCGNSLTISINFLEYSVKNFFFSFAALGVYIV